MARFKKIIGKRIGMALLILHTSIFYHGSIMAQPEVSVNTTEATSIVNQYFQAIMSGDIDAASSLLDQQLLEQKMGIFSNPSYPQFLQNFYKNAQFEIVNTKVQGNAIAVDVMVTHQNKDASQFRLWLRDDNNAGLRIFMETN